MDGNGNRPLPVSKGCFVCGCENPAGLRTQFYVDGDSVKAILHARPHHCGYESVVHGGIVAAALDECMAWAAARTLGLMCVTAELTIRYIKRVPEECDLTVSAWSIKSSRRIAHVAGTIRDQGGATYARAEGRFMPMSIEETLATDDQLVYIGGEERIFDKLRA